MGAGVTSTGTSLPQVQVSLGVADWQKLKAFDADGNESLAGSAESVALLKALGGGDTPLTLESAETAVAKLGLGDKHVADTLVKALVEVNTFTFVLDAPSQVDLGARLTVVGKDGPATVVNPDGVRQPGSASGPLTLQTPAWLQSANGAGLQEPANLPTASGGVVPEDGSFVLSTLEMGVDSQSETSLAFVVAMAQIGAKEGFGLVVQANGSGNDQAITALTQHADASYLPNVTVINGKGGAWTQDNGEIALKDGTVLVPPDMESAKWIESAIADGRQARGVAGTMSASGSLGKAQAAAVERDNTRVGKISTATALHRPISTLSTYLEGGNLINATGADGRQRILVGRDTVATNQALLTKTLGRPVSESETLAMIAKDLGLQPDQVAPIEQPGLFHLDMGITAIAPGEVLLNDAMAVYELQARHLQEAHAKAEPPADDPRHAAWETAGDDLAHTLASMKGNAEAKATMEAKTATDLEAAGFTVHRLAGTFPSVLVDNGDGTKTGLGEMNFLNALRFTNPKGERVAVLLGGNEAVQAAVTEQLRAIPGYADRMYFLDSSISEQSLALQGGVNCRSKMIAGQVVPPTAGSTAGVTVPGQAAAHSGNGTAVSGQALQP